MFFSSYLYKLLKISPSSCRVPPAGRSIKELQPARLSLFIAKQIVIEAFSSARLDPDIGA